jgi:cyclic pyranopterin phosphate synthase
MNELPVKRRPMTYDDALAVARAWRDAGGTRTIELGALEPLLWKDGDLGPADLVGGLVQCGMNVTMTTNGSCLISKAHELKAAGLSLLRISWHTTDPLVYRDISGHGDYRHFWAGLCAAVDARLKISFNRTLLRGYCSDLPEQLNFISSHNLRLKLHDLMWTPEIASIYRDLYQDWRCVVRRFVLPRTVRMERIGHSTGRRRIRFYLQGGGHVEVKLGDAVSRDGDPCRDCSHGDTCLEGFGDYVRVEPELNGYYCYLRRDLRFSWREIVDAGPRASAILKSALHAATKGFSDALLRNAVLRYIVVPFCNYNCFVPGTSISWCHKTSGNFMFPGRPQRTDSNHHFIVLNQKGSECHE